MDLQAIRYAAMVANMTLDQAIDAHQTYLKSRGMGEEDAASRINAHLTVDAESVDMNSSNPRIILVSANFSKELTTSVLWLNQIGMNITCIKLQPWKMDDALFLESSHVIPIPEAEDYMVRVRNREEEAQRQKEASRVKSYPGSDQFRQAIDQVHEDRRSLLHSLLCLAVSLEQEGLAKLFTRSGSTNTVLRVQLPNESIGFFNALISKQGDGYLNFGSSQLLDSRAPKSKDKLEQIFKDPIRTNSMRRKLPDRFLQAMTDAYREAIGQEVS